MSRKPVSSERNSRHFSLGATEHWDVRRFSPEYLDDTRRGLWSDRTALEPLLLDSRDRILDVGCGTGELTTVLREETDVGTTVVGVDVDPNLLAYVDPPTILGDGTTLPCRDDSVDLVACQALLVNLPTPVRTLREFGRVSSDLVAVIEPDNAAVSVDSTVDAEGELAARLRDAYISGVETDVTLGSDLESLLTRAGLEVLETTVHYHYQRVEPPYTERDVESARLKAAGTRVTEAADTLRAGGLSDSDLDAFLADWQSMGDTILDQMDRADYRRAEIVPFHIAVARVPSPEPMR